MKDSHRVLLINDEEAICSYLREKLTINGGNHISVENSAALALENFKHNDFDVVISKFDLFDLKGPGVIKSLKQIDQDAVIIILIDDADENLMRELDKLGVYDYINKPISLEKLFVLVNKGAELRSVIRVNRKLAQMFKEQNTTLQKQNTLLAKRIEESTKNLSRLYEDLRSTYMRTIRVLAHAIDARDHYTHSHSENVAKYAVILAEEMHLSVDQIRVIRDACELHDLGKIGVEDCILSKPTPLTEKEWECIRCHPIIGAQILEPLTFLEDVIDLIRQHHEHYNGAGYPQGLKGGEILLGARIINLADAYEAMRSARSYRKEPLTKDEAIQEIKKNNGGQFDPKVVEAFLNVVDRLP